MPPPTGGMPPPTGGMPPPTGGYPGGSTVPQGNNSAGACLYTSLHHRLRRSRRRRMGQPRVWLATQPGCSGSSGCSSCSLPDRPRQTPPGGARNTIPMPPGGMPGGIPPGGTMGPGATPAQPQVQFFNPAAIPAKKAGPAGAAGAPTEQMAGMNIGGRGPAQAFSLGEIPQCPQDGIRHPQSYIEDQVGQSNPRYMQCSVGGERLLRCPASA
eukprot:415486-Hanusia_phi.AAC.1